jgi:hypothetical protein
MQGDTDEAALTPRDEAIAKRAARLAVDILVGRVEYAAKWGRRAVNTFLWICWAIGVALGIWHHEALLTIIRGG